MKMHVLYSCEFATNVWWKIKVSSDDLFPQTRIMNGSTAVGWSGDLTKSPIWVKCDCPLGPKGDPVDRRSGYYS